MLCVRRKLCKREKKDEKKCANGGGWVIDTSNSKTEIPVSHGSWSPGFNIWP